MDRSTSSSSARKGQHKDAADVPAALWNPADDDAIADPPHQAAINRSGGDFDPTPRRGVPWGGGRGGPSPPRSRKITRPCFATSPLDSRSSPPPPLLAVLPRPAAAPPLPQGTAPPRRENPRDPGRVRRLGRRVGRRLPFF